MASKTAWASRRRPGSESSVSAVTSGPSGIGSQRTAISSSDALPQIPHDAVADEVALRDARGVERLAEADR